MAAFGAQAGVWVRVTFRQSGAQFQISEFGLYDANGVRINTGMTNKTAGTDPATLAAKQYTAEPAGTTSAYGSCLDNSLNSKWYQEPGMSTSNPSTWKSLVMRLADDARPCGYLMATANDLPARSPTCWTVQASTNGTNWTDVDVRDNEPYPDRTLTWWRGGEPYPFRYPWISYYAERVLTNVPYSATSDLKCGMLVTDSHTGEVLTEGEDYSLAYSGNTGIGTASVTVTGLRGAYEGVTDVRNYQIVPAFKATLLRDHVPYRGGEPCPCGVVVSNFAGTAELVEGRDYELVYANHTAVGTASVTVNGINDYEGNFDTQTFKITPLGVWTRVTFMQNGNPNEMIQLGELKVCTEEGDILTTSMSARNYDLVPDLPQKGFFVSGQNMLASDLSPLFDTVLGGNNKWCKGVSGLTVANGPSKWIELTMRLADGSRPVAYNFATANDALVRSPTHWTFSVSTNGYDWTEMDRQEGAAYPGTASTWWNGGEPFRFEYPWIPFQTAVIQTNMFYRGGTEHKCGVVVRDFWTKETLTEGTDYYLEYADNREIGKASVTIIGLNKYADVADVKHFTIEPAFFVATRASSVVYDYVHPAECGVVVSNSTLTAELVEGRDYEVVYRNNDRIGTATVAVSGIGDFLGNFEERTFTVTSPFKRIPARYTITTLAAPQTPMAETQTHYLYDGNYSKYIEVVAADVGALMDFGTPRHVRAIALVPRSDSGLESRSQYFKAWGSNDLKNWTLVHTNFVKGVGGRMNEFAVSSGIWQIAAYRWLYVGNIERLNVQELGAVTDELLVEATAAANPFASDGTGSGDAAAGVLLKGRVLATDPTPATVEAFAADRDYGDDYAAWTAHGVKADVGTVTPGESFSVRVANLPVGRCFARLFARRGDEISSSQPIPPFVVGSQMSYPRVYVSSSSLGFVFDGSLTLADNIAASNWAVFDFSNVDFSQWKLDGYREWGRQDFYHRMIGRVDFGYGPSDLDWGATTPVKDDGKGHVIRQVASVPSAITWVNGAESYAGIAIGVPTCVYFPFRNLSALRPPRYVRVSGFEQWNLCEFEFRLLPRPQGCLLIVK